MQLIKENVTRKIDGLGRVSFPKGMRDRLSIKENDELEFYTLITDGGKQLLCAAPTNFEMDRYFIAAEVLDELGVDIPRELRSKL